MAQSIFNVTSDNKGNLVDESGNKYHIPEDWIFLPAGDAGLTRKVTSQSECYRVVFKKGRRVMSKGIWAPSIIINSAKKEMEMIRSTETYQKKQLYDQNRREKQQLEYELEFRNEIEKFLNFSPKYRVIAKTISILVTQHAIPVGSGTVARTSMIPIEERAAKAVIAWMRHQTTAYDNMHIPRIKGQRRSVRKQLAKQSLQHLEVYKSGMPIPSNCPVMAALQRLTQKKP